MPILRYGNDASVRLEFDEGVVPNVVHVPRGQRITDLDAAMKAALAEPIDYPPLARSTTPADRVVLVLDRGVPRIATVTAGVVRELVAAGVDPDGISVLRDPTSIGDGDDDPLRLLEEPLRNRISLVVHDPEDRRQMAYLAADASGEAILVNRHLHDADVVLPIGCLRGDQAAGYFGIHSSVFPAFSDAKTIHRYRGFASLDGQGKHRRELIAAVDNVAWLLGVYFTIQIVPAGGDGVLRVLAGQSDSVRRLGRELYQAAWGCSAADRTSLVIVGIEGDRSQQTWENLGRALAAASLFLAEDGAVAVCCELSAPLGSAMQRIGEASSLESALRHIGKDRPVDALPAAQIAHSLQQHKVYLLSRLDPTTVEDLDIVPIADADELIRLVRHYPSCTLLPNAPYTTCIE